MESKKAEAAKLQAKLAEEAAKQERSRKLAAGFASVRRRIRFANPVAALFLLFGSPHPHFSARHRRLCAQLHRIFVKATLDQPRTNGNHACLSQAVQRAAEHRAANPEAEGTEAVRFPLRARDSLRCVHATGIRYHGYLTTSFVVGGCLLMTG